MTNHLANPPPSIATNEKGVIFKLNHSWYNLIQSCGHLDLRRVLDGTVSAKRELSTKDEVQLWHYLASAARCTPQEARRAYEDALQNV